MHELPLSLLFLNICLSVWQSEVHLSIYFNEISTKVMEKQPSIVSGNLTSDVGLGSLNAACHFFISVVDIARRYTSFYHTVVGMLESML